MSPPVVPGSLYHWPGGGEDRWVLPLEVDHERLLLCLYDDVMEARKEDVLLLKGEALPEKSLFGIPALATQGMLPVGTRPVGCVQRDMLELVQHDVAAARRAPQHSASLAARGRFGLRAARDASTLRSGGGPYERS